MMSIMFNQIFNGSKEATHPSKHITFYKVQVGQTYFNIDSRYQNLKAQGDGAYGTVVSALDSYLCRMVAIKKIRDPFANVHERKLLLREIKLLRHFKSHENIISIYDIMTDPPDDPEFRDIYIVTSLFESDLERVIKSNQNLSNHHIQFFIYQILRGLKYIHSAHVLHRDLKPSNILVNSNCDIAICDFGLSRGINASSPIHSMTEYVVTRWYRAPELLCGCTDYTSAIDIWSVGCILAELINKVPFFRGSTPHDQLNVIITQLGCPDINNLQFIHSKQALATILNHPHCLHHGRLGATDVSTLAWHFPHNTPYDAIDLMHKMFEFNPNDRITAANALLHPFLKHFRGQVPDPDCPTVFDCHYTEERGGGERGGCNNDNINSDIQQTIPLNKSNNYCYSNNSNNNFTDSNNSNSNKNSNGNGNGNVDSNKVDRTNDDSTKTSTSSKDCSSNDNDNDNDNDKGINHASLPLPYKLLSHSHSHTVMKGKSHDDKDQGTDAVTSTDDDSHKQRQVKLNQQIKTIPTFESLWNISQQTKREARYAVLQEVTKYRPIAPEVFAYFHRKDNDDNKDKVKDKVNSNDGVNSERISSNNNDNDNNKGNKDGNHRAHYADNDGQQSHQQQFGHRHHQSDVGSSISDTYTQQSSQTTAATAATAGAGAGVSSSLDNTSLIAAATPPVQAPPPAAVPLAAVAATESTRNAFSLSAADNHTTTQSSTSTSTSTEETGREGTAGTTVFATATEGLGGRRREQTADHYRSLVSVTR